MFDPDSGWTPSDQELTKMKAIIEKGLRESIMRAYKESQGPKGRSVIDNALEFVSRIPGVVVCNCHSKVQTMDEGNKVIPYIDGSTKDDISKWFDFVFYTKTTKSKSGEREYVWITKRCETYDHAKDRTNLLPAQIPQNYQLVIKAAKDKGFEGAKILVIGSPGSGKTLSLKTLTKEVSK